jgi:Spy/CpxP family protein refolding chaperone
MKNYNNKFLIVAVVLLLLTNIFLVFMMLKGKGTKNDWRNRKEPFEMMAKELKMTEEQRKEYKLFREEHQKIIRPLFDSIRVAKTAYFDYVKENNAASEDSAFNIYKLKVSDRMTEIDKLTFAHFKKVRALFTPEQLPQFDEFLKKMMQRGRRDSSDRKR